MCQFESRLEPPSFNPSIAQGSTHNCCRLGLAPFNVCATSLLHLDFVVSLQCGMQGARSLEDILNGTKPPSKPSSSLEHLLNRPARPPAQQPARSLLHVLNRAPALKKADGDCESDEGSSSSSTSSAAYAPQKDTEFSLGWSSLQRLQTAHFWERAAKRNQQQLGAIKPIQHQEPPQNKTGKGQCVQRQRGLPQAYGHSDELYMQVFLGGCCEPCFHLASLAQ